MAEIYCYYHMRTSENPPDTAPPDYLDYEMWTGPAPMRPYNALVHPRGWRAFMEYGNGIVGDMCVHMLDMVRWMLGLGWPQAHQFHGRHSRRQKAAKPTSPTRRRPPLILAISTWFGSIAPGAIQPIPKYPWGATLYGDKGTLKPSVNSFDFTPFGNGRSIHRDVVLELEKYPEDKTEKDLEKHVAPAIRGHMVDLLKSIATRGKPVADIEQGHISTASCILANMSMKLGRSLTLGCGDAANRRRSRSQQAAEAALSSAVGSSDGVNSEKRSSRSRGRS